MMIFGRSYRNEPPSASVDDIDDLWVIDTDATHAIPHYRTVLRVQIQELLS